MRTELYRHFDKDGRLLYVGVSLYAVFRLVAHRSRSAWFREIAKVTIERFPTRVEAERAEYRAITDEHPLWNHSGVDARHPMQPIEPKFREQVQDKSKGGRPHKIKDYPKRLARFVEMREAGDLETMTDKQVVAELNKADRRAPKIESEEMLRRWRREEFPGLAEFEATGDAPLDVEE